MENIILDLDTGIDDSLALALAISDPSINLLGVTTTFGNVQTEISCSNSRFILDLLKAYDIPVLKGLDHATDKNDFTQSKICELIHGKNGLGNIKNKIPKYKEGDYDFFVPFVLEQIEKYGNSLTYVTTGPLTNVAHLINNYYQEISKIKKIVSMGGALIYAGNVSKTAEANIFKDPQSAKIVLESDITSVIVPLDVTQKSRISTDDILKWKAINNEASNVFYSLLSYYIENNPTPNECYVHDPSAVMYCIDKSIFTTLNKNVTVLTECDNYGRIVGDLSKIRDKKTTSILCLDVEEQKVNNYINESMIKLFSSL